MTSDSERTMREALDLAARSSETAPNPMVGCIILDTSGNRIAVGWHRIPGTPHAEAVALSNVQRRDALATATLYVTLEPCCHQGRTPACSNAIIESGIKNVVIGCLDPNPLVAGKGVKSLQDAGIAVTTGVLAAECRELNKRFLTYHEKKRPYLSLKWAETADGFIAPVSGERTAISGSETSQLTHEWRAKEAAIWVGTSTAVIDNPQLTIRHSSGKNPIRILIDRSNRVPNSAAIFNQEAETILFTQSPRKDINNHVHQIHLPPSQDPIASVLQELTAREIQSVLVEGGAQLHNSLLQQDLWDEIRVITSPTIFGNGLASPKVPNCARLQNETMCGEDIIRRYGR